jgi:hypothetical protein
VCFGLADDVTLCCCANANVPAASSGSMMVKAFLNMVVFISVNKRKCRNNIVVNKSIFLFWGEFDQGCCEVMFSCSTWNNDSCVCVSFGVALSWCSLNVPRGTLK